MTQFYFKKYNLIYYKREKNVQFIEKKKISCNVELAANEDDAVGEAVELFFFFLLPASKSCTTLEIQLNTL